MSPTVSTAIGPGIPVHGPATQPASDITGARAGAGWTLRRGGVASESQEPRGHVPGDHRHNDGDEHLGGELPVAIRAGIALRILTSVRHDRLL